MADVHDKTVASTVKSAILFISSCLSPSPISDRLEIYLAKTLFPRSRMCGKMIETVSRQGGRTMKMPKEKIDTAMFAPCGMNCLVCYKHCYHKKTCAGCLNSDMGKPEHCRKCKIKECIKGKGQSYCFECPDYPCKLIKNLEKSYNKRYQASLMENSEFVRQHGLERFMEQQKEKYTCPKCRGIISIHDRECSECQERMK